MVNYTAAGQSIQQNLTLNPLGYLSGVVYLDDNVNGQRDSGEAAATGYVVTLLNDGGLPVQTATPDANGVYLFTDSERGRALPGDRGSVRQPGGQPERQPDRSAGLVPAGHAAGAGEHRHLTWAATDHNYNTVYGRVSSGGAGVAGIRIGYFHWVPGAGLPAEQPHLAKSGDDQRHQRRLQAVHPYAAGERISPTASPPASRRATSKATTRPPRPPAPTSVIKPPSGAIVWHPGYWQRDITLIPAQAQALEQRRDDPLVGFPRRQPQRRVGRRRTGFAGRERRRKHVRRRSAAWAMEHTR